MLTTKCGCWNQQLEHLYKEKGSERDRGTSGVETLVLPKAITDEAYDVQRAIKRGDMNKHELWELQSMQAAPLSVKIMLTKDRIREWIKTFGEDGVYVSFSGGKDSTVLLHLVREDYPNVPAVFCDVPTQYPELKRFAQTFDNVDIVKPKISFAQVCEKYGFPLISKEVSETVSGARKYLTRVIKEQNALTNERTNERDVCASNEEVARSRRISDLEEYP